MRLDMRITDTLVHKSWGVWSLSTEELKQREDALEWFNNVGSFLGLSFSGATIKDIVKGFLDPRKIEKKANAMLALVIGGLYLRTSNAESRMEDEIGRRAEDF